MVKWLELNIYYSTSDAKIIRIIYSWKNKTCRFYVHKRKKVRSSGHQFTTNGQNGRAHSKDGSGSPLVSWHFCYVRCDSGIGIFLWYVKGHKSHVKIDVMANHEREAFVEQNFWPKFKLTIYKSTFNLAITDGQKKKFIKRRVNASTRPFAPSQKKRGFRSAF